jgi:hypothetical protein
MVGKVLTQALLQFSPDKYDFSILVDYSKNNPKNEDLGKEL